MNIKIELNLSRIIWLLDSFLKVLLAFQDVSVYTLPTFENTSDVTSIAGTNAELKCKVQNLGNYTVAWVSPKGTVISRGVTKVTDDTRISIERQYMEDWNILIRNVTFQDRGNYNCVVNTSPIPCIKRIYLYVNVPPMIQGKDTSLPVPVFAREGETVTLVCNATGFPPPRIHWFRDKKTNVTDLPGDTLVIRNITRHCAGEYQCRANNGLQMVDTRVFILTVRFAPEVSVLVSRLGITLGSETVLQCSCSASPIRICVWKRNGNDLRISSKYEPNTYNDDPETITLSLTIFHIQEEDLGRYECHAQNLLGEDSDYTFLYEYKPPIPSTLSLLVPFTSKITTPSSRYRPVQSVSPRNIFDDPFDPDENIVILRPSTVKTPSKYSSESSGSVTQLFEPLLCILFGLHFVIDL
uniref:Protein amalgam-like n=1 Tax=Crassostrea virginica TaxID=6565 RepID=A0A8B8DNM9_CRAVI|nr:protein amalgam-like [Crassostrea virginica]XP_022329347.1 protein amalgam-like [Crassostrea virginica]XP_022329348.1 protein amalgam-like [Crassostrea virginica]